MISKNDIRTFIQKDILKDDKIAIEDKQDLLISGLLDSMNVMRLVTFLETQCNISIPAEDVLIENFGSLNQIEQYLNARNVS